MFIYAYFILNNGKWEYTIMQNASFFFFLYAFDYNNLLGIVSDHTVFSRQKPAVLCFNIFWHRPMFLKKPKKAISMIMLIICIILRAAF